jgi:hypothetical protein
MPQLLTANRMTRLFPERLLSETAAPGESMCVYFGCTFCFSSSIQFWTMIFVGRPRPAQDFDGDVAIQLEVVGSIELAHPAASEPTEHAVVRNACPDFNRGGPSGVALMSRRGERGRPLEARS